MFRSCSHHANASLQHGPSERVRRRLNPTLRPSDPPTRRRRSALRRPADPFPPADRTASRCARLALVRAAVRTFQAPASARLVQFASLSNPRCRRGASAMRGNFGPINERRQRRSSIISPGQALRESACIEAASAGCPSRASGSWISVSTALQRTHASHGYIFPDPQDTRLSPAW